MKLNYPHPELPKGHIWLSGKREGAPIFLDPYMQVWGLKKIKQYYEFSADYRDGYWLFRGSMTEFTLDIRLFGYSVLDYFLKSLNFNKYLLRWWILKRKVISKWNRFPKESMLKLSQDELIAVINDCQKLLIDVWAVSPIAAMIGDMATEWLDWWLDSKGITGDRKEIFLLIFYSNKKTETIKRQEIIKMELASSKDKSYGELIRKFGYAKSNFGGYHEYTAADIEADAKSEVAIFDYSQKRESLLKKLGVNSLEKRIFDLFAYCQYNRDERMAYEQRLIALADWTLMELAARVNIDHKYLKYSLVGEINTNNLSNPDFKKLLIDRYDNGFLMYWCDGKDGQYVTGDAGVGLFNSIDKQENLLTSEIKGQSAYKGNIKGRVKIISGPKDTIPDEPFVLVASMTSPDFVHFVHKCLAIITDEGGITCHAAILARELKKPTIIGTKIATKVLKDGDMVEVDADNGIVRIIK